jgi:hypothetical protein
LSNWPPNSNNCRGRSYEIGIPFAFSPFVAGDGRDLRPFLFQLANVYRPKLPKSAPATAADQGQPDTIAVVSWVMLRRSSRAGFRTYAHLPAMVKRDFQCFARLAGGSQAAAQVVRYLLRVSGMKK